MLPRPSLRLTIVLEVAFFLATLVLALIWNADPEGALGACSGARSGSDRGTGDLSSTRAGRARGSLRVSG